jgi:hypothetical protein
VLLCPFSIFNHRHFFFFFNSNSRVWSPTGSTRHVGHQLVYCTYPGWLWWRIWWNDKQGKSKYSEKTCPSATLSTTNPTWPYRARTRAATVGNQRLIFLIGIVGGGVQLGPLDTAATNRPIVPAPGDYDGEISGMMIGRGNRSTQRKPAPVPLCKPQIPHACPEANPDRRGGKTATNRLS